MLIIGGAFTPFVGEVYVRVCDRTRNILAGGKLLRSEIPPTVARIGMENEAVIRSVG